MTTQGNPSAVGATTSMTGQLIMSSIEEALKMARLKAVLDLLRITNCIATYKVVAAASGWYHRDQKFHTALGQYSRTGIKENNFAVSAVVCSAGGDGYPTMPGRQFFLLLEEEMPGLKIPRKGSELDQTMCQQLFAASLTQMGMDLQTLKRLK